VCTTRFRPKVEDLWVSGGTANAMQAPLWLKFLKGRSCKNSLNSWALGSMETITAVKNTAMLGGRNGGKSGIRYTNTIAWSWVTKLLMLMLQESFSVSYVGDESAGNRERVSVKCYLTAR
jgi:hypothetical protein